VDLRGVERRVEAVAVEREAVCVAEVRRDEVREVNGDEVKRDHVDENHFVLHLVAFSL
jgi:hypothetical protein